MAMMTMSAGPSALNPSVRPYASSPLASNAPSRPLRAPTSAASFPTSRPLRPFASVANSLPSASHRAPDSAGKRPVKIIEPPADVKCEFVLNLTQAEFSRQE